MLGDDLANGQRPMVAVPAGVWMGAATSGDWSLVGTTMAPGFDAGGLLGDAGQLAATYPEAADGIARLTRSDP